MNIDDENDCMNCGMCHDCIVLTMETAHEAQAAKLRAEIERLRAELETLKADKRPRVNITHTIAKPPTYTDFD